MESGEPRRLTNPAKRLHSILDGTAESSHASQPFRKYLSAKFGGNPDDDLDMFRKLLGLYDLVSLADRRISTLKHPKRATFARCINPIVTVLQQTQLNTQASHVSQQLANGPIHILDLASDALDQEQPEFLIEQTELDTLLTSAQGLASEISSSTLPLDLKSTLLTGIERIKTAIKDYALSGAEGLDRAIKEAYGTAFVEHSVILPEKDNPLVKAYWDWLGKINSTVTAAKNAYAVGLIASDVVVHLLEHISR